MYKLKATTRDGAEFLYVIDGTTFLAKSVSSKASMQGQLVDVVTSYSDYRKTDVGFVLPYAMMALDYAGLRNYHHQEGGAELQSQPRLSFSVDCEAVP